MLQCRLALRQSSRCRRARARARARRADSHGSARRPAGSGRSRTASGLVSKNFLSNKFKLSELVKLKLESSEFRYCGGPGLKTTNDYSPPPQRKAIHYAGLLYMCD